MKAPLQSLRCSPSRVDLGSIAIGEARGQTNFLLGLLHAKFGEKLPPFVEERLHAAEPSQLEHWGVRVLTAGTLEQVFSDH